MGRFSRARELTKMSDDRVAMSLDDLIKTDKSLQRGNKGDSRGKRRGGGGGGSRGGGGGGRKRFDSPQRRRGGGGDRRGGGQRYENFNRNRSRSRSPVQWKHDKYNGPVGARGSGSERASSRLLVSNLNFGVDDRDMRELFASFGSLVECRVLYERGGRSTGTAEITFEKQEDASEAKKEYHRVPLDGREMNIVFVNER